MNWKRPFRGLRAIIVTAREQATCPRCDAVMTDLYEAGPAAPKPGSFTICWQCDEFLRFTERLKLRQLTDADKRLLDMNPKTVAELDQLRVQIAVARMKK